MLLSRVISMSIYCTFIAVSRIVSDVFANDEP